MGAGVWALTVKDPLAALPRAHGSTTVEVPPLCPWRDPEADLRQTFGAGTTAKREVRILSAQLLPLQQRLGRPTTPDERALQLERASRGGQALGTILLRRVKGRYGAVELVLAVTPDGKLLALRIQREREPEAISSQIRSGDWLAAFRGKTATDPWRLGADIPNVSGDARPTALAIVDGVRATLILLETAESSGVIGHQHH